MTGWPVESIFTPLSYIMGSNRQAQFIIASPRLLLKPFPLPEKVDIFSYSEVNPMQASHQSLLNPFSPPLSYIMGANRQAQFIIASPNHFSTFTVETISSFRERGHNPLLSGQSYAAGLSNPCSPTSHIGFTRDVPFLKVSLLGQSPKQNWGKAFSNVAFFQCI